MISLEFSENHIIFWDNFLGFFPDCLNNKDFHFFFFLYLIVKEKIYTSIKVGIGVFHITLNGIKDIFHKA